jgi:hypothetical protein
MVKIIHSGGGIQSNKLVRPSVQTGDARTARKMNPGAVDQLGQSLHFRRDPLQQGTMPQVPLGNEVALNSKSSPGQGRTIHASGSQAQHGPVVGTHPGPTPDILREYGPDMPVRGQR